MALLTIPSAIRRPATIIGQISVALHMLDFSTSSATAKSKDNFLLLMSRPCFNQDLLMLHYDHYLEFCRNQGSVFIVGQSLFFMFLNSIFLRREINPLYMSQFLKHLKVLCWWPAVVALCPCNLCCDAPVLFMDLLVFNMGEKTTCCCFSPPVFLY